MIRLFDVHNLMIFSELGVGLIVFNNGLALELLKDLIFVEVWGLVVIEGGVVPQAVRGRRRARVRNGLSSLKGLIGRLVIVISLID